MDPTEIVVYFTNAGISSLWAENKHWQRAYSYFFGETNNKYPKSKRLQFIKRTKWFLLLIVLGTPISGAHTFYSDINKSGEAGYKSENLSKMLQSH